MITDREKSEIDRANGSDRPVVVFVHGLWLLPGSWDAWRLHFEDAGYATLAPGWPDDPLTVEEARRNPEVFAHKGIQQITDHYAEVVRRLRAMPAVVGHSFGGMMAQKLAGMGLSRSTVAIDPAPFRGILPLPFSALKASFPVLGNPANYNRAVALTYEQFRFAFANAIDETEAKDLYERYSVAGSGVPLFQAATANLNPWTQAAADTKNPKRGPLLILSGEKDNTVPRAIAHAQYRLQKRNPAPTEFREITGRGHSLIIDHGWREVADIALGWIRQAPAAAAAE
jgi:non-heme chloroperoxidase